MVPYTHTVVVYVNGGGDPDKQGVLKVVLQYFFEVNLSTRWFHVPRQSFCGVVVVVAYHYGLTHGSRGNYPHICVITL